MKKILLVISTLSDGGAQKVFANISVHLPKDWQIDILLNDTDDIVYPYRGNLINLGIKPQKDKRGVRYQTKVFFRRIRKLRELKKKGGYDVCLSAMTSANIANIISGRKYCKVVASEHNYMTTESEQGIKRILIFSTIKLFYNFADKVVAVSQGVAKDLCTNFGVKREKIYVIYNGFDVENIKELSTFDICPEENVFRENKRYIITIGRITYAKGQWHLIRSLMDVKKVIPEICLVILGQGELEEDLKRLIDASGLTDNVILGSFVENPYKYIKHCEAFVFPSLYEGFGNVLIESMCCGVPCISTDYNVGAREILAPDTDIDYRVKNTMEFAEYGVLCPVCKDVGIISEATLTKEEKILAEAIIKVMQEDGLREKYIQSGYRRIEEFDMTRVINQWIDICEG